MAASAMSARNVAANPFSVDSPDSAATEFSM